MTEAILREEMIPVKKYYWFVSLSVLIVASLACGLSGGGTGGSGGGNSTYNAKFPLPTSVTNFTNTGNDSINFQTDMSLKDTIAFYREAFAKAGLTERTLNTAITDTTFSMVFDGDPSGQAIVVQGVDLANGKTNVSIRYEKV
jgi:hypothetical protein